MASPFEITAAEHEANMVQFAALGPVGGRVTGEAARSILLKSGLPPPVLGQIWALSDLDKDGQLDQREFSIAMKLTRNAVQGMPLPPTLPPQLLNVPLSGSMPRAPPPIPGMAAMPSGAPPSLPPGMMGMGGSMGRMPGAYPLPGMHHGMGGPGPGMMVGSMMGPPPGAGGAQFPVFNTAPAGMPMRAPPVPGRPPVAPGGSALSGKQLDNWTMPQANKLKYAQQFNAHDKQRTGFLNGQAARNVLGQSGLPTNALAHVWMLSDVNKDGRLSVEEFEIAMWLIEQNKAGFALPSTLPPELAGMCHHTPARSDSPATPSSGEAPAQKIASPKTFEDKRKDNYDRGQAELDRRRQILQEEEDRRRAEEAKKERDAQEKRERERLEMERRREAERAAEMERRRQMEEERMEEERKRAAERERQRQEAEAQKKKVALEKRKRDLAAQKAAAIERLATQEQKRKTMQFQLQALDEKAVDLDGEVAKAREAIEGITKDIEGMRALRDEKLRLIAEAQKTSQQAAVQAEQLAHQLLQLQGANRDATSRSAQLEEMEKRKAAAMAKLEQMKKQVETTKERNATQRKNVEEKQKELEEGLRKEVEDLKREHAAGLAGLEEKKRLLQSKLSASRVPPAASQSAHNAFASSLPQYDAPPDLSASALASPPATVSSFPTAFPSQPSHSSTLYDTPPVVPESSTVNGHHDTSSNGPLPSGSGSQATVKYRAIYAFDARSDDELSFQPGDSILVFEGHAAEPGWLAGQVKDKVGWFPVGFAEPIAPINTNATSPMQTVPSNVTPSPSLEKILEEPNASTLSSTMAVASAALGTSLPVSSPHSSFDSSTHNGDAACLATCVAQFPWKARNPGDLSFAKGDAIEVLEKTDMKWRGRRQADGTVGWFPKSYVKVVEDGSSAASAHSSRQQSLVQSSTTTPTSSSAPSVIPASASVHSVHSAHSAHSVEGSSLRDEETKAMGSENETAVAGTPMAAAGEWYVAVYDFEAVEATDLPLVTGDRIYVTEKNADWWKGSCNGREGIFPANYVGPIERGGGEAAGAVTASGTAPAAGANHLQHIVAKVIAPFQAAGENQLTLKVGDTVTVRSRSEAGWWEGEIHDEHGNAKVGWFPGDYVQVEAGSPSSVSSPVGHTFVALFDYDATQTDELSFKAGDAIIVVSQSDTEWWTGYRTTDPTTHGLFPANYVQASPNPHSAQLPPATSEKLLRLLEELRSTEVRYHADLVLVKKLFYRNLRTVMGREALDAIFLNWTELIQLSAYLTERMAVDNPGVVFSTEINKLAAFVTFCSQQTSALQRLERELQNNEVRRVYAACCQNENSRGLSLSYFLLLPLGRITRYPLLFEKMFQCTPEGSELHTSLDVALQLLKSVVSEVNLEIREADNLKMLCWTQQHVRCDSLREKIEFTSQTRNQGPRTFVHSGILYKARSGKLLVCLLFNDFLLLTTPDETVESFKVSPSSDVHLTVYKTPLLLSELSLVPIAKEKDDDVSFSLKCGEECVHLRAANRNARTLWLRQLDEALNLAAIAAAEIARKGSVVTDDNPAGRLLLEVIGLQQADPKLAEQALVIRVSLLHDAQLFDVPPHSDLTALKLTTQYAFMTSEGTLVVGFYRRRHFSPDQLVYEEGRIPLAVIVADCSSHRGPLVKAVTMKPGSTGVVVLKNGTSIPTLAIDPKFSS